MATVVGVNAVGQPVFVGDQCTITGVVASISGSGKTATVTVTTDKADSINVKLSDCIVEALGGPYGNLDSTLPTVQSNDGQLFGATSRECRFVASCLAMSVEQVQLPS
jgi:hypothetical protein